MFVIKVYQTWEGDLPAYADAVLDVDVMAAKAAACARLDGARLREPDRSRPWRARVYRIDPEGPNLLVSELHATAHGAVEIEDRSN